MVRQSLTWFLFYWKDADIAKCKLDVEETPEFTQLAFVAWDDLMERVWSVKHPMYTQLRQQAEPIISEFLAAQDS